VVVDIHRDAGLRVAQPLAYDLNVVPRLEHQAGIGMALVVDANAGHPGPRYRAVIVAGEVARLDRRPQQEPPLPNSVLVPS
jgi:hypothetical protein